MVINQEWESFARLIHTFMKAHFAIYIFDLTPRLYTRPVMFLNLASPAFYSLESTILLYIAYLRLAARHLSSGGVGK